MIPGITASQAFVAGAPGESNPFVGTQIDTSSQTTYTFNVALDAGKTAVIFVGSDNASTWRFPTGNATLNSVEMNFCGEAYGDTSVGIQGYTLDSPGTGTFPFEITFDGAQDRCAIAVFQLDGTGIGMWDNEVEATNGDTADLNTQSGGKVFGYVYANGSGGSPTPTSYLNLTSAFDEQVETSGSYHSGAIADGNGSPITVSATTPNFTTNSVAFFMTTTAP